MPRYPLLAALVLLPACTAPPASPPPPSGDSPPDLSAAEPLLPGLRPDPGTLARDTGQGAVDEESQVLWRAFQDTDASFTVPPTGRLRVELWADGSAEEDAGNALSVSVTSAGTVGFALRLGKQLIDQGSTPVTLGADRRLRLRLRKPMGGGVQLFIDVRRGGAWEPQRRVFGVDNIQLYQGRRVRVVEQPEGGAPDLQPNLQIDPQMPEPAFSWNRSFDRMSDWALYARGAGGRADVPLSFAYRATAAAVLLVEVLRADGSPPPGFAPQRFPLPASAGRAARATLRGVPQGGNYQLRGRLLDMDGAALGEDSVREIAVGDVFLAIGQSNMSGFAPLEPREEPSPSVHLFGNDYRWRQAREPMDSGDDQVDRVSEEQPEHSLMLSFGKEISRVAGVPVAVIPGPRYGTNIDYDWLRRDDRPAHRGTLYGSALSRARVVLGSAQPRAVLWYQGEGNAGSGTENYLSQLGRLVTDLRRDLGGRPFFANCQLATLGENRADADMHDYLEVQEAQRRYAALDAQSGVVGLVDLPRDDPWHLNNLGIREAGRRLARVVLAGAYGLPQALGPQLRAAAFAAGRRDAVELTYDKPLRGGEPALYRALDDAGAVAVSGVSVSGARVTVQLRRVVAGQLLLSYGYSSDPAARWLVGGDGSGAALAFLELPIR